MTYTTLESIDPFYAACLKLAASPCRRRAGPAGLCPAAARPENRAARCRT